MLSRSAFVFVAGLAWSAVALAQDAQPSSAPAGEKQLTPGDMTIEELLAVAERLYQTGRYPDAATVLELVLQREETNVEAMIMRGEVYEMTKDLNSARTWFLKVQKAQPNEYRANLGLGRTYAAQKMWRQAIVYLEVAQKVAPPDKLGDVLTPLAIAYHGTGLTTKAVETVEKSLQLDPDHFENRRLLGLLRLELEQLDKALTETDALLRLAKKKVQERPGDITALQNLGEAYELRQRVLVSLHNDLYEKNAAGQPTDKIRPGNEAKAAALIKESNDLRIYESELRTLLAYHAILPAAERVVSLAPDNPEYLNQLGLLRRRVGLIGKAIETFQKAIEIDPTNAVAREQLASMSAPLTSQPTVEQASAAPAATP
jgi:tetratricopeptide (TPR) repeat protein